MRLLMVLGVCALILMGIMVWLVMGDDESVPDDAVMVADHHEDSSFRAGRDKPILPGKGPRVKPVATAEVNRVKTDKPVNEDTVQSFGQEFERKWYEDRRRLGKDRHKRMEELWFKGRRPRGDPKAMANLEKLLKEFPDTNRAGCAALELGHHYMRSRSLPLAERRKKAEEYWTMVEDRYSDTLCEYNAPAKGLSMLALANWVYKDNDPGMARRLLEEIIEKHKGETDHLGRPLEMSARRILESLK